MLNLGLLVHPKIKAQEYHAIINNGYKTLLPRIYRNYGPTVVSFSLYDPYLKELREALFAVPNILTHPYRAQGLPQNEMYNDLWDNRFGSTELLKRKNWDKALYSWKIHSTIATQAHVLIVVKTNTDYFPELTKRVIFLNPITGGITSNVGATATAQ